MSEKKLISLYESIEGGDKVKCRLCGKEIYYTGEGYGMKSHARAHVRRGEAKELHHQSPRCYAGYDIEFVIEEPAAAEQSAGPDREAQE